ncbi:maleylpyruvate isomerase family mycothiol-dependent enzyme [Antrihabitans cavernicola]|uniref:maleylpyruvate isomerase family mycothiol-dependent enzyme n=1 Tax=Antrihabitans cavernicola TaxID=2495913 RepID=UPI001F2CFD50|nr:maleylpyruvate isomerase family mycothiol-dependent enzyme [Spelaeibacter cavernicola]
MPEQLKIVRRGTAYFAQRLVELNDSDLDAPSTLPNWTRKHVVAHVGYNADALGRLLDWAETGVENPMYESMDERARQIAEGANLGGVELRNLFNQSAARLDEQWRQLSHEGWRAEVRNAKGAAIPAADTVWMRAREVWIHAIDLGTGATFDEFPESVLEALLADVVDSWRNNDLGADLIIEVDGREPVAVQENSTNTAGVRGSLAAVTQWAVGRGAGGLSSDAPAPPAWL